MSDIDKVNKIDKSLTIGILYSENKLSKALLTVRGMLN